MRKVRFNNTPYAILPLHEGYEKLCGVKSVTLPLYSQGEFVSSSYWLNSNLHTELNSDPFIIRKNLYFNKYGELFIVARNIYNLPMFKDLFAFYNVKKDETIFLQEKYLYDMEAAPDSFYCIF